MCAQHFWGFPLYRQQDGKMTLSNASNAIENQTFGAGVTKKYINVDTFLVVILYNS